MELSGRQFLPCAGLADDQDRGVPTGDRIELVDRVEQRRGPADERGPLDRWQLGRAVAEEKEDAADPDHVPRPEPCLLDALAVVPEPVPAVEVTNHDPRAEPRDARVFPRQPRVLEPAGPECVIAASEPELRPRLQHHPPADDVRVRVVHHVQHRERSDEDSVDLDGLVGPRDVVERVRQGRPSMKLEGAASSLA